MTPNKQVSPVIRISRGERDASARATHLEAAFEKYSKTTIERKQMSKTTNFKRIALVAVAALGLGVLSSAPSNAAINADTFTLSAATAAQTTAETYTATSATVTLSFLASAANDSISVTSALVSAPAGGTALPVLRLVETTTAVVDSTVAAGGRAIGYGVPANTAANVHAGVTTSASSAKFAVYLATSGATTGAPVTAGTYVVKITPAAVGASGTLQAAVAQTLTITVTAAATLDKTPSAATSKVYIQDSHSVNYTPTSDSTVVASKATGTSRAYVYVKSNNAAGSEVTSESITAEISGKGLLQNTTGSTTGLVRILDVKYGETFTVFADGTEGVGTITVKGKTSGVLIATKTLTFYGAMASIGAGAIAATDTKVITPAGAGADTTKVSVFALDAGGNKVGNLTGGTDIFAISDSTSIATVAFGSYSATTGYGFIVTGVAAGTANITFANASTLAAATIKSAAFPVKVGSVTPASVKVAFDKATYAPGEKATLTVSLLDANGALLAAKGSEYADIFATGGIVADKSLGGNSVSTAVTGIALDALTQVKTFSIDMPVVSGGAIKFSWTGGTGLATANQVAGSTTVTVTDTAAQALAAVTALATTVASLRTLIVTLTNLVLKIQKKVKA
jgi:hypothetical protein